jgi:hypothetical protein
MVTLRRLAAAAAVRLLHRRRPAPVDSLAVVLNAAAETGAVVTVPGLAAWLGWEPPQPDGSVDPYGAYLEGLSQRAVR